MSTTTRRTVLAAALVLAAAAPAVATAAPPAPTAASAPAPTGCEITWGSLPKQRATSATDVGTVTGVRSGQHPCFDRLVIDLADTDHRDVAYSVRYVDALRRPGDGQVVPLLGGARLQLDVGVPTYDEDGEVVYAPADPAHLVDVTDYRTLRQVALAGSFEGQTTTGVGVRARLPFRVLVLDGPGDGARLVVDVAHRW